MRCTLSNTQVITGGTGGIGGATARSLSSQGASVALFDIIPQEKGQAFAQELGVGDKAKYYKVDITDSDAVKAAVEDVVASLGNLKGAVHCAGVAIKREWTNDIAESIPNFKRWAPNHWPCGEMRTEADRFRVRGFRCWTSMLLVLSL